MTENILEIKDLHVTYHTDEDVVYAVNGLDLTISTGESMALVGETGAGKTTTALSIMRLLPNPVGSMDKGKIILDNHNIQLMSESEMRMLRGKTVSMIFQDPMTSLNPIMSVGDQIKEVLELHEEFNSKIELNEKVDLILDLVGISKDRKTEFPHQFSGGMKQRIVIAIALACRPKLILADEPTTALDVTIQAQVLHMITELKEQLNTSLLLITHDLGIVADICDKVAIMYAGRLVEVGTVFDIFEGKNHHPYTLGLFGSIPNLYDKSRRLNPIDGLMPDPTDLPKGCSFHPRCPSCMEICRLHEPINFINGTHSIYCHMFSNEQQK